MTWLVLLFACNGKDDQDAGPALVGPEVVIDLPASTPEGQPFVVELSATDPDGVGSVSLFHRTQGATEWLLLPMAPGEGDRYSATIEAGDVDPPALELYVVAADNAEVAATTTKPGRGEEEPYVVQVDVSGAPLPFYEDFELAEGETELTSLGWNNYSDSFRGYPWQLSDVQASSGTWSAFHPHGYEGTDGMRDWLLSPALDLSTALTAQVSWKERGLLVQNARHKLLVSVGSRHPADGDFVPLVESLPAPPDGEWGSSARYDLSEYVGEPEVYLAWYFEGVDADDWHVDDVRVEEVQPDLDLDWSVSPSPLRPGEAGTLSLVVVNLADAAAGSVELDLAFPEGGVSAEGTFPTSIGEVAALGSVTVDVPVTVDAATFEPSHVPMTVGLTWGGDLSATFDEQFLVGEASVAHVEWAAGAEGSVRLTVGVGDPDAPSWSSELWDGRVTAGSLVVEADVSDQAALLPPAAGENRWFLQVSAEAVGQVDAFTITHLGETSSATVLLVVSAGEEGLCWLPEPPDLVVESTTTTPSTLAPGSAGVELSVILRNDGATTAGPLTATLVSTDPDVTVLDAGPAEVSGGTMEEGGRGSASGFTLDVSTAHVDSTPVTMALELSDGAEQWTLPVSLDVPYPVLHITSTEVDDDGRDGVLDPDESAELSFGVSNVGDLATSGVVYGTLSAEATSTATVTVSTNSESYTALAAGGSQTGDPYDVVVTGGVAGDTVDLLLTLVDSAHTYEARTTLVLGEPPWQAFTPDYDTTADTLDGWDFDLYSGEWRVMGDELQLRLTSAVAFDPSTLFIEAWGQSTGAEYLYYRIVLQSGVANLQGYDSSTGWFTTLDPATVSYPDALTVQLDMPITNMGLFLDNFELGFGSGWCAEPDYYCDHWPNGWGYPYSGFSTAYWFDLSW